MGLPQSFSFTLEDAGEFHNGDPRPASATSAFAFSAEPNMSLFRLCRILKAAGSWALSLH
jgi:hypothetical protein